MIYLLQAYTYMRRAQRIVKDHHRLSKSLLFFRKQQKVNFLKMIDEQLEIWYGSGFIVFESFLIRRCTNF